MCQQRYFLVREKAHSLSFGVESNLINQARKIASGAPPFDRTHFTSDKRKRERKTLFFFPLSQEVRMVWGGAKRRGGTHKFKNFRGQLFRLAEEDDDGRSVGRNPEGNARSLSLSPPFSCRKNRELSDLAEGKRKEEEGWGMVLSRTWRGGWPIGGRRKWGSTERVCLIASSIGKVSRIVIFLFISLCLFQGFLKNFKVLTGSMM